MAAKPAFDEQGNLWNGPAGHAWVDRQELLDLLFTPFEQRLVEAVSAASAKRVLDVGCGTGSTTLAIARKLGARGHCTGVDISEPMIAMARNRAEHEGSTATFTCDDAQTHAFAPAAFDMIVSRFGVMFFDDSVRAFANLRQAASEGAELRCIVWRSAAENPFMTTAERAAAPLLPNLPARQPGGPGQFAFADRDRVCGLLDEAGWAQIDVQPIDVICSFPESQLVSYVSRLGPVGLTLQQTDEPLRTRVIETVRAAFEPFVIGSEVRLTAACWMVAARTPGRASR
ncbi:class I SAM-dependent methyltransferase [Lysobacter tyrosinilyticus]